MRSVSAPPPADPFDAEEFMTLLHLLRGHHTVNPKSVRLGAPQEPEAKPLFLKKINVLSGRERGMSCRD